MKKGYVPVFFDWTEVTEELNDQEKGRLIDAVVLYAQGGDWQQRIQGNERFLFPAFRKQIDRANEISEVRAKAGSEGGKAKQGEATESKAKQSEAKPETKRFKPPTLEEVKEYCESRKNGIDPEAFVAFYASKGWKVGSQTMKDWKQAVITWEKRNRASSQTKKVVAQEYDQRDYSDKDKKMQDRFWMEGIL